jgi:DNA primase
VVLAFDADSAGQAAADRFYEWERAYDVEVAVADLPGGVDPDDLARDDPDQLVRAVRDAQPFLGFRVARVLDQAAMSSPERRARAAHDAVAVIAEHPDPMVRDQYLMQVADRCGVDAERLRQRAAEPAAAEALPRGRAEVPSTRSPLRNTPETEALRLAIHRPGEAATLLDEVLFADELHAAAFRALASAQTLHEAIEGADPAAADLLQQLAVEDSEADALDVASRLADNVVAVELSRLDAEMRHSEDAFKEKAREHTETKLNQERLRDPHTAATALEELVGWLRDRAEER